MFPSHRFQWLKPANSDAEVEVGKRNAEWVHLFLLTYLVALTGDFG